MKAKSIVLTILSVIFIGLLSFGIIWTINNFDKIKLAFSGTSLYTKEDVDAAYQDGYDTAVTDKQDLLTQITSLRAQLDERNNTINVLNKKLANYNALSTEAASLRAKVTELEKEVSDLEKTIASYEEFLQDVESSNKIIATFMLDGAVYKLQAYNSGDTVSIQDPENTDEITFNGWTVNGEFVELSTYTITENTTFVADITKSTAYVINFTSNDTVYETVKCFPGSSFVVPSNPTAEYGYEFKGWSVDGENIVEVNTSPEEDATYVAVFDKITICVRIKYYTYTTDYYFKLTSKDGTYSDEEFYNLLINQGKSIYYKGNQIMTVPVDGYACTTYDYVKLITTRDLNTLVHSGGSLWVDMTFVP